MKEETDLAGVQGFGVLGGGGNTGLALFRVLFFSGGGTESAQCAASEHAGVLARAPQHAQRLAGEAAHGALRRQHQRIGALPHALADVGHLRPGVV
jgi:hypothetical protein